MSAVRGAVFVVLAAMAMACSIPGTAEPVDAGTVEQDPCGGCPPKQVCDAARVLCVMALAEGALCDAAVDGGVADGLCGPGMTCGSDGSGTKRCSLDCTSATAEKICGAGRTCMARPDAPHASSGFCVTRAGEGETCDSAKLIFCSGSEGPLQCVAPSPEVTAGRCFGICDPREPDCRTGQECASPFASDPTLGICVTPSAGTPRRCDYPALQFCGDQEICIRPTTASWGFCHKRCDEGACASPQQCVRPGTEPFCAAPLQRCAPETDPADCASCDPVQDHFCAAADTCVQVADRPVCKQDCSATGACEAGGCTPVVGTEISVCL